MKVPLMFLLAMLTPLLLGTVLLAPIYAGLLGACYLVYMPASGAHPLAGRLMDVFYIVETYGQLFHYWTAHLRTLSIIEYALPIVGLPLLTTGLAIWLTIKLSRQLLEWFHMSSSV